MKLERNGIQAVPLVRRRRAIVEYVPEMRIACGTADLGADLKWDRSVHSVRISSEPGDVNEGQPIPDSNFSPDLNRIVSNFDLQG